MDLDAVTAVVSGGAAGIGAGIAHRLAAGDARVILADLDEKAGQATAARVGGSFVRADVATGAGVRAAIGAACRLPAVSASWSTTRGASRGRPSRGRPSQLGAHP